MKKYLALMLSLLLIPTIPSCIEKPEQVMTNHPFTVKLLDTGKSDCILIFSDSYTIVIDTADEDDADAIKSALRAEGVARIDLMILTHYDNDHIGSAPNIIDEFEVTKLVGPDYFRDSYETKRLEKSLSKKDVVLERLKADELLNFGNMTVQISIPEKKSYDDKNDFSLIVTLKKDGKSLLFLGDACKERLTEYIEHAEESYDFVKLPHHGEYTKALKKLIEKSTFTCAAICESKMEDSELTELLEKQAISFYRTYRGDITLTLSDDEVIVSQ